MYTPDQKIYFKTTDLLHQHADRFNFQLDQQTRELQSLVTHLGNARLILWLIGPNPRDSRIQTIKITRPFTRAYLRPDTYRLSLDYPSPQQYQINLAMYRQLDEATQSLPGFARAQINEQNYTKRHLLTEEGIIGFNSNWAESNLDPEQVLSILELQPTLPDHTSENWLTFRDRRPVHN